MRENAGMTQELSRLAMEISTIQAASSLVYDKSSTLRQFALDSLQQGYWDAELGDVHKLLHSIRQQLTCAGEALRKAEEEASKL